MKKKTVAKKSAAGSVPKSVSASGKSHSAETAAKDKKERLKRLGLTRIQKHLSAESRRRQARRDSKA